MSEERVSRSASFAFLAQMVGAALTAVLTIFLGRRLSAEQYGSLTFAISVVALAALFADLGITSSTVRFMAERRGDPSAAANVLRTGLRLKLRVGLIASATLFALAGPICDVFGVSAAAWPLRGLAVSLLGQSTLLMLFGAFIALGRLKYNLVIATIESVVEVLASIALVLLGAAATGAAFGSAIGYGVGVGAGLVMAHRAIGNLRSRDHDPPVVSSRQILSYARPLLFVDAAFRAFSSIDVLLIAAIVGGGAPVASFGLAVRLTTFLEYPAAAVASAVAPRFGHHRSDASDLALFAQSLRYLLIMQMLFAAPLVVWSDAIVHLLFGGKYPEAPAVLQALAPYVLLSGIAQVTTLSVNYLGEAGRRVRIAIAMLSVNVVIDVVLLPRIGIVGGGIGTSAAYALWAPAHVWILRQRVGLQLRPLLITTARVCVGGAAMVGSLALLGTGAVPLSVMIAGIVVGPGAYFAALFAVRELTLGDIANLRSVVARRVTT